MVQGILLKGYGGFYYVSINGKEVECSLRGKFRLKDQKFLTGDIVTVSMQEDGKGVIDNVAPRKNVLLRPPIANAEQVVIVMALKEPEPQLDFLDRLLVLAEFNKIIPVVCFNKADKVVQQPEIIRLYRLIGYEVLVTSVVTRQNIDRLALLLEQKISVFAGLSGVGKSSLLNAIKPDLLLKTGKVSEKNKRGKHTTRHVGLIALPGGGMVADSPGFSNLALTEITSDFLRYCFPEIEKVQNRCRFSQCFHWKEPDCAVKKAVEYGEIAFSRYENYVAFYEDLILQERRH